MNILVTGGAGFIGSHTCVALLKAGHSLIIVDNFSNSNSEILKKIQSIAKKEFIFYNIDVTNKAEVEHIFATHSIDGVIHFAGLKSVSESIENPLFYYYNNIVSTLLITDACKRYGILRIVFSSSATVYGDNKVPFKEEMELLPTTNPYGETKAISERILQDFSKSNPEFAIAILRYFNPIGAHESGKIGENPNGLPNNLMPYVTQVAKGKLGKLKVFGGDYSTFDGTGVRDYIHVMDLAEGHLAALHKISSGVHIYNLGTGQGTSVLQLIHSFEQANDTKVPYEIVDKRSGDIAISYADVSKAKNELGWQTKYDIIAMCRDAWRYENS
jgi:UDP-glucose 4-epimerase